MGFLSNLFGTKPKAKEVSGYLVWNFGMTKEQVVSAGFGPYQDVPSTGGCETFSASFNGKPTHVSFIFTNNKLSRIQIWAYSGPEKEGAVIGFTEIYKYLKANFTNLESPAMKANEFATPEDFQNFARMLMLLHSVDPVRKIQLRAVDVTPANVNVFASMIEAPGQGCFAFLYFDQKS